MRRRLAAAGATVLALFIACQQGAPYDPAPCDPIPPQLAGLPDDTVWGFADLHAHPAIERAFGGRLIWGSAIDDAPIDATQLPMITACPVETHDPDAASPLDRAVGGIVFPNVAKVASFAHGPVGDLSYRPSYAWPDARDVIHQQMNVASIRRAYEGGLRLMFASTTDDQVIRALLAGPNFINGFVPDPEADFESAKSQIRLIQDIVSRNSNWMAIARSPQDARSIILGGRLAIVVSLEMNGMSQDHLDTLVDGYGVRHIIPIHLIDNDIGGTACNSDLFNAASATVSEIYRPDKKPMRYMDVVATSSYGHGVNWPQEIGSLSVPLYVSLNQIPYKWYSDLCYEPLAACSGTQPAPTSFIEFGQQNLRGLCGTKEECLSGARPGKGRIAHMMDRQLFVDVSHMSANALEDTLQVSPTQSAPAPGGYPLVASHGDFVRVCPTSPPDPACVDGSPGTERSLSGDAARSVVGRHGVLGLGLGTGTYNGRTLIEARGGPLLTFDASTGRTAGCVAQTGSNGAVAAGCEPVPSVAVPRPSAPVDTLQIATLGSVSPTNLNGYPFVRVVLASGDGNQAQSHVFVQPLECTTESCNGTIRLGSRDLASAPDSSGNACAAITCQQDGSCGSTSYSFDDIQSVSIQWLYLGCDAACQAAAGGGIKDVQCQSTGGSGSWTIEEAVLLGGLQNQAMATLVHHGPRSAGPITRLDSDRGSLTLYQRGDRASASANVPATGHLLRVTMQSGAGVSLLGANTESTGANVCVAVRHSVNGTCAPPPALAAGATECPTGDGWARMNQRGAWSSGASLYTFVRSPEDESSVCGVDVAVLDWDNTNPPWAIDEIRVEAIEDPLGHYVRRYAEVSKYATNNRLGAIAFGTDFNGLNGLMDISEFAMPPGSVAPSACPAPGAASGGDGGGGQPGGPIAPMRLRHADGSLGDEVLIEQRGLATYGLLSDMLAIIGTYPKCGTTVRDSLLLSAEATIRAWELMVNPNTPPRADLPPGNFDCGPIPGLQP
jgi:microsomal dipeptidase-like Zn-dependent dipeptidase